MSEMTLYKIDTNIREFLDSLYSQLDEDGTISDEDYATLEMWQEERKAKLENIAVYYKELVALEEALENEAKKLLERAKTAERRAEWFKRYLATSMIANGDTELQTSRCTLSFRKSEKVVVNEDQLPRKYFVEKINYTPDKKTLKELLKKGETISGASLEVTQNIQIK